MECSGSQSELILLLVVYGVMKMTDFTKMTKEEALRYCHEHANKFKAECYESGEDGVGQFDCLIEILSSGTISPSELPDYGMEYDS